MLFDYIRILKSISSTLTDISYENQDESLNPTLPLAPSDFLLIGMQYPFNNFFMNMDTLNGSRASIGAFAVTTPYNAVGPVHEVRTLTFSSVPTQGVFKLGYDSLETSELAFGSSASGIETALRALAGLADVTVTGTFAAGFEITLVNVANPEAITVEDSTLARIEPSAMTIQYWDGSKWVTAVDVMDGTSVSGASLSKSGHVLFSLDKTKTGWGKVNNPTINSQGPTELATKHIYDLYWLKITFSGQIPTDVSLKELGFAWTTGQKLKGVKSEVDRYLTAFAPGKTNWIPEIMTACKMMVTDLKKAGLVLGPQQVIRMDDFWLPATYKTLWLIYSSLGPAYLEQANAMAHQFYKTMNVPNMTIDQDRNGSVSDYEKDSSVFTGVR